MNIKKVVNRTTEELYSTIKIAKCMGVKNAFETLKGKTYIQKIVHGNGIEYPKHTKVFLKKHKIMNDYFSQNCNAIPLKPIESSVPDDLSECVWVCWWQGIENAPDLVKRCIESIKINAGPHKVIIITDKNYYDYVDFPDWVIKKYQAGTISKTHLSDILRLELLSKYGGLWIDATFFCCDSIVSYFAEPLWSIKRPNYRHISVACGQFANYSFGCNLENRTIFKNIEDYLLQYWNNYNYMVDYLFLDYLIVQAQKNSEYVRNEFEKIKPNNPKCDELVKILGKKYDVTIWNKIKKETKLFKLTWKTKFPSYVDGEKTFYGKLIDGELL